MVEFEEFVLAVGFAGILALILLNYNYLKLLRELGFFLLGILLGCGLRVLGRYLFSLLSVQK